MKLSIWRTPFAGVRSLQLERILTEGTSVVFVLAELLPSGPPEDLDLGRATIRNTFPLEVTPLSRRWRVTFPWPIASFRVSNESFFQLPDGEREGRATSYLLDPSPWVGELDAMPLFRVNHPNPKHVAIVTGDEIIEAIVDELPEILEVLPAVSASQPN